MPVFDNLYLDMNGIIHQCSHPDDNAPSPSERDMLLSIFAYIDRIVKQIVRPQKVLYIAVDGVAPRAKLNQQRSRRFAAAKEASSSGGGEEDVDGFDRNCITPGTSFMARIGDKLRGFIRWKIGQDPAWSHLKVVYSGANVPGEGEHKIMQYIRANRETASNTPPTRHCMYGNDADLIMLGLCTHEPYFTLLREIIDFGANARQRDTPVNARSTVFRQSQSSDFQLLHISILREYIQLEFCCSPPASYASHIDARTCVGPRARKTGASGGPGRNELGIAWRQGVSGRSVDLERLVDDFVFLTFFVGNDFLPHSPSLDIGEHAFNRVFDAYKRQLATWPPGDYLTDAGDIANAHRLQRFISELGAMEPAILADRRREAEREQRRFSRSLTSKPLPDGADNVATALAPGLTNSDREKYYLSTLGISSLVDQQLVDAGIATDSKTMMLNWNSARDPSTGNTYFYNVTTKETAWMCPVRVPKDVMINGTKLVRCSQNVINRLSAAFVEGLAWCLAYYVKGCVDWRWFFPCHYCPMLSDVVDVATALADAHFEVSAPLRPLEQLMSCLPPASARLLPRPHRALMLEESSPLHEFYPSDFDVDMEGKRNPWEGVNLLPFIEVDRLLNVVEATCKDSALAADERKRSLFGRSVIFSVEATIATKHRPAVTPVTATDVEASLEDGGDIVGVLESDEHPYIENPWLIYGPPLRAVLKPGCSSPMPGFPSLHALPITSVALKALKLNCFGSPSRYETMCVNLPSPVHAPDEKPNAVSSSVAAALMGKSVFVDWPMTHEALLVAVTGGGNYYSAGGSETAAVNVRGLDVTATKSFNVACAAAANRALVGSGNPGDGGVDIGPVDVVLTVRLMQGLRRDAATGALKKTYGRKASDIPLQLALSVPPNAHVEDPRFQETKPGVATSRFLSGSRVIIQSGPRRGRVGIVHQCEDSRNTVTVELIVEDVEPQFGFGIAAALADKYASASLAATELGVREDVLAACCGSVLARDDNRGFTYDLGLRLCIEDGAFVALGFCRAERTASDTRACDWSQSNDMLTHSDAPRDVRRGTRFEYSAKAIRLVATYLKHFPAVFDAVGDVLASTSTDGKAACDVNGLPPVTFAAASRIFGHEEPEACLLEVCKWLAGLPTATTARMPISTRAMSPDAVAAVQRAATKRAAIRLRATAGSESVTLSAIDVRSEREATDFLSSTRIIDPNANLTPPRLGERVVTCNADQMGAPFGHRGTVIATHAHSGTVDVVFDTPFVGGTSLQGACDNFRGLLCPWSSLLTMRDPMPDEQAMSASDTIHAVSSTSPAATRLPSRLKDNRIAKGPDGTSGFAIFRSAGHHRVQPQLNLAPEAIRGLPGILSRTSLTATVPPVAPKRRFRGETVPIHVTPALAASRPQSAIVLPCAPIIHAQSDFDVNAPPVHSQLPTATTLRTSHLPVPDRLTSISPSVPQKPATPNAPSLNMAPPLASQPLQVWSASTEDRLAALERKLHQAVNISATPRPAIEQQSMDLSYGYQPSTNPLVKISDSTGESSSTFRYVPVPTATRRMQRNSRTSTASTLMLPSSLLGMAPVSPSPGRTEDSTDDRASDP